LGDRAADAVGRPPAFPKMSLLASEHSNGQLPTLDARPTVAGAIRRYRWRGRGGCCTFGVQALPRFDLAMKDKEGETSRVPGRPTRKADRCLAERSACAPRTGIEGGQRDRRR
jgi:hypothetical protein